MANSIFIIASLLLMPAKQNVDYGKKSEAFQKKKDYTEDITQYYLPDVNGENGEELFDLSHSETIKYIEEEFEVMEILNVVDFNDSRNYYVEWKPSWVYCTMFSQACLDTCDQCTVNHKKGQKEIKNWQSQLIFY